MRVPLNASSRSASIKVAIIVFLTLVLLIPVSMIDSVIRDRRSNENVAAQDIGRSWGLEQVVTGPVLRLPYEDSRVTVYGAPFLQPKSLYILASDLRVDADVTSELRYRGIHTVPVFSAVVGMEGSIGLGALEELGIDPAAVDWNNAELLLGISDAKGVAQIPEARVDGVPARFRPGTEQIPGLPPQLGAALIDIKGDKRLDIGITLRVNGTGSLSFLPLADSAEVKMSSEWPSPSFSGRFLPLTREVDADGFEASWQVPSLGRKLPAYWVDTHTAGDEAANGAFGVRFIQPVGLYQLMLRAIKYAVLFVGLTFVSYFVVEVVADLRLHPLQYLLVGLANTLFYLLLLSLAEHIGFDLAYAVSAVASGVLIIGYSASVLAKRSRAALIAAVLAGLYAFLYLTLKAESYALLAGALGLWVVLAAIMYLTRGINWYGNDDTDQGQANAS